MTSRILPQHRYVSIPPGNYGYGPSSYHRTPLSRNLTTYNQSPGIFVENEFPLPYSSAIRKFNESEAALWYYNIRGFIINGEAKYLPKRSFTERKKNIQEGFWVTTNYKVPNFDPNADSGYGIMPSFYYQQLGRNGVYDYIAYFFRDTYADPEDDNAGNYPNFFYEEQPNLTLGEETLLVRFNDFEGVTDLMQAASTSYNYPSEDDEGPYTVYIDAEYDLYSYYRDIYPGLLPDDFDYSSPLAAHLTCTLLPPVSTSSNEYWTAYGSARGVRYFDPSEYATEPPNPETTITANNPIIIPRVHETRYYAGVPYYLEYPSLDGAKDFTFEIIFDD